MWPGRQVHAMSIQHDRFEGRSFISAYTNNIKNHETYTSFSAFSWGATIRRNGPPNIIYIYFSCWLYLISAFLCSGLCLNLILQMTRRVRLLLDLTVKCKSKTEWWLVQRIYTQSITRLSWSSAEKFKFFQILLLQTDGLIFITEKRLFC